MHFIPFLINQNTCIMNQHTYAYAGMFTTALRWVVGWTYFSAFWRRLILENKLNPEEAGYIGEKFNHFLPNALGIKPIIEYLVSNPESLWWANATFTIIEGIVGLLFMLGLFTRLMSVGVFGLALGILLGSGWLGTTCLDEWQIGILGIAAGFSIFFTGGGKYSLDSYLINSDVKITQRPWFAWIGSGILPLKKILLERVTLFGALFILSLSLFTNQYFHGGVYGTLHNKSVAPQVDISEASISGSTLTFTVYRYEGADVYGSFLIGIELINRDGRVVYTQSQEELAQLTNVHIDNAYVAKVKAGAHSLILPLGAKAKLTFDDPILTTLSGPFELVLTDISGTKWRESITAL